jgi:hypothetical protein
MNLFDVKSPVIMRVRHWGAPCLSRRTKCITSENALRTAAPVA